MAIANVKRFLVVVVLMIVLGVPGASVVAQDDGDEPEPVTVVDGLPSEEEINEGTVRLSEALGWILTFIVILEAQGLVVSGFLEETIKPLLTGLVENEDIPFNDYVKTLILLGAAFGFGVWQNTSGNINLLENTPYPYFDELGFYQLAAWHGGLAVASAFVGHRTWELIGAWTQRAKRAVDAFGPTVGDASQPSVTPMPTN